VELRQLVYFDAVVRHGGFTRAAEQLRIAQPAVSAQIRRLESELGVTLLRRTTRHVALTHASHALIATVPCDSPFLPGDLVFRLRVALDAAGAQLAVARTFDQPHPVFALVRRDVLAHLTRFLEAGGRKIDAWYATLNVVEVAFDDEAEAFSNFNTLEELSANEK